MELNAVLKRVRALVERAEHPATPTAEAELCRERADELMTRYAIEELQVHSDGRNQNLRPAKIYVDLGERGSLFTEDAACLAHVVASYCRCRMVWLKGSAEHNADGQEKAAVFGYEGDLRYFELLYTTLYLHMNGAIFPKPDPALSEDANAYVLHTAGLNWLDIANVYGWLRTEAEPDDTQAIMYHNKNTGERKSNWTIGSHYKRAYYRECKRRHVTPLKISASASFGFRKNAASGYVARIGQRLRAAAGKREHSTELALADRDRSIDAMFTKAFPEVSFHDPRKIGYNAFAYEQGVSYASKASLDPEAATTRRPALGG